MKRTVTVTLTPKEVEEILISHVSRELGLDTDACCSVTFKTGSRWEGDQRDGSSVTFFTGAEVKL